MRSGRFRHRGTVRLHCTIGGRASYLWVAYVIRYQSQAPARGEAIAISPSSLAGLLRRPLAVVFAAGAKP